MKKIHITTLGCAKNLVDSEVLAGQLGLNKHVLIEKPEEADVIIVNTCGFIEAAKKESLGAVFEALELKEQDPAKQVFVSGCLSGRYKESLQKEIPEIDGIFGTEEFQKIVTALGGMQFDADNLYRKRQLSTPRHYAWLKISEGCNHTCSFCAIPGIRGKHRSRSIESILDEAKALADQGVRELLLVSQDTSYYGKDLYGDQQIVELLEKLAKADLFKWIRPLYWYPTNFPRRFLDLINEDLGVVPYLDMPIQHASDNVLKRMRRAERSRDLVELYKLFREKVPNIALRSTVILGHPGETEDDFHQLRDFIQEVRFDRLGTFIYSDEDGTTAFDQDMKVDTELAVERQAELMEIQQEISFEKNEALIGSTLEVLIDEIDAENSLYVARSYRDAPEIDNEILITSDSVNPALIGTFQKVSVYDNSEFELYASLEVEN